MTESPQVDQTATTSLASQAVVPPSNGPLFRQLEDDSSDSDSTDSLNLSKLNEKWARHMLALDTLRSRSTEKRKGGKKHQLPKPVLETPEMRQVKDVIASLEREYLFDRKEAGMHLKAHGRVPLTCRDHP